MSHTRMEFTFSLPYSIRMVEGQVCEDITIPLTKPTRKLIIHPPKASEKRFVYQSSKEKHWIADKVIIDIELEKASATSLDALREVNESISKEYLRRFLRYCRIETKQFWIDLRQEINPSSVVYADQNGQRQTVSVMLTLRTHGVTDKLDDGSWEAIRQDLITDARIPFHREALLDAKLYKSHGDYRMAAVSAAMGIEAMTTSYLGTVLRQELVDKRRTTQNQVDKFVDEISNRLLVTVGLGLLSGVDGKVLEGCRQTMQLRNDVLHGKRRSVSSEQAKEAINNLERLMSVDEIRKVVED